MGRTGRFAGWVLALVWSSLVCAGCFKPTITFVPTSLAMRRSLAIPDTLPLGSVIRAHYEAMETNGEAGDFIIYRREFVDNTAELTPDGKDHILEIAARMRSAPFPVIVERSENNSDPELDQLRRNLVAQILTDLGNPDAQQRTIVAPPYGRPLAGTEAVADYYQFIGSRGYYGNYYNQSGYANRSATGGFFTY